MTAAELVLVRHAQSEWNAAGRIQGQGGTGLSALGAEQAERTAAYLAATFPEAVVACSDLQRCRETVAPLAARTDGEITYDEGLRERSFGDWTGHRLDDVAEQWPDLAERWKAGEDVLGEVGGESTVALVERVVGTLRRLVREVADGGMLICVTHGGPVWHGTHALVGLEPPVLGGVANTSLTRLALQHDRVTLLSWNEVSHLPAELQSWMRGSRSAAPRVGR